MTSPSPIDGHGHDAPLTGDSNLEENKSNSEDMLGINGSVEAKIRRRDRGCLLCISDTDMHISHISSYRGLASEHLVITHVLLCAAPLTHGKASWITQTRLSASFSEKDEDNLMYRKFVPRVHCLLVALD